MEQFYLSDDAYGEGVPSIIDDSDEFHDDKPFPSVVDRYYTKYHSKKSSPNGDNEDHLVLFHSNKVCLVMLDKSHVAFTKGITEINYDIGNCDRSQAQVKGKHKKGGMNLQPNTCVAMLTTADGSQYKVFSCVQGKLIEVNERVKSDLKRLAVEGEGYIAVVLLKPENYHKSVKLLVDDETYKKSNCSEEIKE